MKSELLLISLFPIASYLANKYVGRMVTFLIVLAAIILLMPTYVMPYHYTSPWVAPLLITFILSGIFAFLISIIQSGKWIRSVSITLSILLFIFLLFMTWAEAMGGSSKILNKWSKDAYEVSYIESSGFSGQPLYYYQLKKYKLAGILEADLDQCTLSNECYDHCTIRFYDPWESVYLDFDKCKGVIIVR